MTISRQPRWIAGLLLTLVLTVSYAALQVAAAASAPAGSVIGNQATATYEDFTGQTRQVTSNLIETVVAQVASVDLVDDQTSYGAPGSTVYLPHTITNGGNGTDIFDLVAADANPAGGDFDFSSVTIYADADGDGRPDNLNPISATPALLAGESFSFVIAATVPGVVAGGASETVDVTVTSQFDGSAVASNTDTVNVSDNAVVEVTKSFSSSTAAAGDTLTVTLAFTNTGALAASNVALTDNLPSGMSYVANSGLWSGSASPLTDVAGGDPSGIAYEASTNVIVAEIANLASGQSGTLSFDVLIAAATGAGDLTNIATYDYDDGAGNTVSGQSNGARIGVTQSIALTLSDDSGTATSTTDASGADDIVLVNSANQGQAVQFDNVLKNTGNASDTFNITVNAATANAFPAGTSFQILQSDGQTPLTDSNGDGIPDVGALPAGSDYHVFIRAILPPAASGTGPYDVTVRATSVADGSVFNEVTDRLAEIAVSVVDITNDESLADNAAAPGAGVFATGEASPVSVNTVLPGQETTFVLHINNTAATADNFDLAASSDNSFATIALPEGWQARFENVAGNIITNSGQIGAGSSVEVRAIVSVPVDAAASAGSPQSLYFRALSAVSGSADVKHDAVDVDTVLDLSLQSDSAGQVYAGGVVEYVHTLTNQGNTSVASAPLAISGEQPAWSNALYYDANGNGVIDAGETTVDDVADLGGLAVGASAQLIMRVFAPAGASIGAVEQAVLTVSLAGDADESNNSITDVTTVVSGDVALQKEQVLDIGCDGVTDGSYQATPLASDDAVPGACIRYRITITNLGSVAIDNAVIIDQTPGFTSFTECGAACAATGTSVTTPAEDGTGEVRDTVGTLAPGASSSLEFTVKIAQ